MSGTKTSFVLIGLSLALAGCSFRGYVIDQTVREQVHYVGGSAELRAAVPPYQHVRSIGEDVSTAELLLPEGHRLRAVDLASAAAAGIAPAAASRKLRRFMLVPCELRSDAACSASIHCFRCRGAMRDS